MKTALIFDDSAINVKETLEVIAYRINTTEQFPFIQLSRYPTDREIVININHIKYMYEED